MAEPHAKLTGSVPPIRMEDTMKRFAERRAEYLGLDGTAAYVRHLIALDMRTAEHDLSVLADALGVQVSSDSNGIGGYVRQPTDKG